MLFDLKHLIEAAVIAATLATLESDEVSHTLTDDQFVKVRKMTGPGFEPGTSSFHEGCSNH